MRVKKERDIYACRIEMALAYFTQKWMSSFIGRFLNRFFNVLGRYNAFYKTVSNISFSLVNIRGQYSDYFSEKYY